MFVATSGSTSIHLQSVWFLLLYASDALEALTRAEQEMVTQGERDNDLVDALAMILAAKVEQRVKSMLARRYVPREAVLTRVRGRIDHLGTARGRHIESGRVLCRFTEQTLDLPRYRYMLVTLRQAARRAQSEVVRRRCLAAAQQLSVNGLSPSDPTRVELSKEQFGHFDAVDKKLLTLSQVVREMCAPEHSAGQVQLPVIAQNPHRLRRLFESAVRGYYAHHLTPRGYSVGGRKRKWPATGPAEEIAFLPELNADVLITDTTRQIVVECKFGPVFTEQYGKTILSPGYVRQVYSYAKVFSRGFEGSMGTVLLGALVDGSSGRNLDVELDSIPFRVRQIDLAQPPSSIRAALDSAVAA